MKKSKFHSLKLISLENGLRLALSILFCIGITLLAISGAYKEGDTVKGWDATLMSIMHEIGVLFVTIVPILFIYELALKRLFAKEMAIGIEEVLNGDFKKEIFATIQKSMPTAYNNITSRGIDDAFDDLDANRLKDKIKNARNTEIKIVKMWIPFLNETLQPEIMVDSIVKQGCSYKIVVCDPDCEDAITNRAVSAGHDYEYYLQEIQITLRYLQNVWRRLNVIGGDFSNKLEVRVHHYFASGSLIGLEKYYILGFYLYGRISTQTMQIKIADGSHTEPSVFFVELDQHFHKLWESAYKDVIFSVEKSYELVQKSPLSH